MNLESFYTLMISQLDDIYDAEKRSLDILANLSKAAHNEELKGVFATHLETSKNQLERLHGVYDALGTGPGDEVCDAARGLARECEKIIDASGEPSVKDSALIAGAQRLEHYEVAAYGTACALAKNLGFNGVAESLHETLDEERFMDRQLTKLAEGGMFSGGINQEALKATV